MDYFQIIDWFRDILGLSPVVNTLAGLFFSPGDDHEDVVVVGDVEDGGDHHLCLAQAQPELLIVLQLVD